MCGFPISFLCVAVPLIARVAVQFVTSSSLEVDTHLTTNGGRDVLCYHVCGLGDVMHLVVCVLTASTCVMILYGALICCSQTVCGVTKKHEYT